MKYKSTYSFLKYLFWLIQSNPTRRLIKPIGNYIMFFECGPAFNRCSRPDRR